MTSPLVRRSRLFLAVSLSVSMLLSCSPQQQTSLSAPASTPDIEVQTSETIPPELMGSDIRPEVGGLNGAVVSEHPLASQMGYEVLRNGGNAMDAAVTMAAMLAVLRPHMNSVGGDAFVLYYDAASREISALNASGRAGALATPEFFAASGHARMPFSGPLSVTVPGAVSAWDETLRRFGTISLAEALQPAIEVAEKGFMISTTLAADMASAAPRLNDAGKAIYMNGDVPFQSGDILVSTDLATSLRKIATQGPGVLYGGELGNTIANYLNAEGAHLTPADFAAHKADWTVPASIEFMGNTVYTVQPNSQGMVLLQMLGMLEARDSSAYEHNSAAMLHDMIEITKLAFADRDNWVADPAFAQVPVEQLLNRDYLTSRSTLITPEASSVYISGLDRSSVDHMGDAGNEGGDTIYLMVVDDQGNAVSWIQSLFGSFGANVLVPGTGIVMQNRGAGFTLEQAHPNQIAPGKRPFHTLMASMVTDSNGDFSMTIGTPGGGGQPQFIFQTLAKIMMFDLTPQQAVESPRYRIGNGSNIGLEVRVPPSEHVALGARGHQIEPGYGWTADYGSMQVIQRLPNGVLRTGADMRREAAAMAY
ncbi:MAG: gamma-glutamyltransferase [Pseudohongiella sp.]|nr:gamma-glutamyltransferase [Pseudohongiella sp.]MDP2128450.1 gamma-glutamyltransferase [Pseudohongiella sp.]